MCPEAKAQIYSVNENLPANQVTRMWGVLDQLERTREKEKDGEAADGKVNCEKSKVLLFGCVSIFFNIWGLTFIPHANKVLADYGKARSLRNYSNKQKYHLPNRDHLRSDLSINHWDIRSVPNRDRFPSSVYHRRSLNWHLHPSVSFWRVSKNDVNTSSMVLSPSTRVMIVFLLFLPFATLWKKLSIVIPLKRQFLSLEPI